MGVVQLFFNFVFPDAYDIIVIDELEAADGGVQVTEGDSSMNRFFK